jgi:amino acid adenylation domain-containing protein
VDVSTWLHAVRASTLAAYAHQDLPFDQIVEAVQPPRSLGHAPLFQVLFSLNNTPSAAASLPGLTVKPLEVASAHTPFDLALSLQEHGGDIVGMLDYATDLFDAPTIQRWLRHWQVLLASLAQAQAPTPVHTLAWVGEADLHVVQGFGQPAIEPAIEPDTRAAVHATDQEAEHGARLTALSAPTWVQDLFAQQARQLPQSCALDMGDAAISYAELDHLSDALAQRLRAQGVGPGRLVAVLLARGPDMIVTVLATLKAGGAYLPLDPAYPLERLRYMLDDACPQVLVSHTPVQHLVRDLLGDHPHESADAEGLIAHCLRPVCVMADCAVQATDVAYVIYTSGSTGQPKGVQLTHAGLRNLASWQQRYFGLAPGDRVLQFASFSFDACTWEWVMALCHGATLCLATREQVMPGPALLQTLRERHISHATLPPVALTAMADLDASWAEAELLDDETGAQRRGGQHQPKSERQLPALRTLIVAGEACPAEVVAHWASGRRFFNAYGPTETTICATVHECAMPASQSAPPIGRPIDGTCVHVLDPHGHAVPIGVAGEVYIGGVGVALGYLNRPELNACSFVADPFSSEPGARMYRTGDLGRWRSDGALDYLGRLDHQVKLRGLRIELGEIESVLRAQAAVRDAVVLLHTQPSSCDPQSLTSAEQAGARQPAAQPQLVAYVVPLARRIEPIDPIDPAQRVCESEYGAQGAHDGRRSEAANPLALIEALRAALRQQLPAHMVPGAMVCLDALPLTPNGKVDRAALLAQAPGHAEAMPPLTLDDAPRGDLERALCLLWQETLGLSHCGRHADFFALGGHSLSAARLMSRAQSLGISLPLSRLFTSPTPALLAEAAQHDPQGPLTPNGAPAVQALPLRRAGSAAPLFLVHELSGTALPYLALSRLIAPQRPVYGLVLAGMPHHGDTALFKDLPELAAMHVQALRQVQPQGPYHLAGWSAGGVLAHEMAAQLLACGEQVAYLGLIDAPCPGQHLAGQALAPTLAPARELLLAHLASTADLDDAGRRAQLARWSDPVHGPALPELIAQAQAGGWLPSSMGIAEIQAQLGQAGALVEALAQHRPAPLPLALHYYAAMANTGAEADETPLASEATQAGDAADAGSAAWPFDRGWATVQGGRLQLHHQTGDHWSMLREPAVRQLAEQLNADLHKATIKASAGTAARTPTQAKAHPHLNAPAITGAASTVTTATNTPANSQPSAPAPSPLVVIQSGAAGATPVFAVPGAGANVTCFVPLALALGSDVPLYGLQPQGLDGAHAPIDTVQAAASVYADTIEAQAPSGPLVLVGHSFGGWVAFDTARQLRARGVLVKALVLLDSAVPNARGPRGRTLDRLDALMDLQRLLAQQADRPLGLHRDQLAALSEAEQAGALHQAMVNVGLLNGHSRAESVLGLVRVFHCNLNTPYVPAHTLDVPTWVVRAQDTPVHRNTATPLQPHRSAAQADRAAGWHALAPVSWSGVVPGNHMSMLQRPHVNAVAEMMRALMGPTGQLARAAPAGRARPAQEALLRSTTPHGRSA